MTITPLKILPDLPASYYDTEFFTKLKGLSESVFMDALHRLGKEGNAAALANALQAQMDEVLPNGTVWAKVTNGGKITTSEAYASAIIPEDRPEGTSSWPLTPEQRAMHTRAVRLFSRQGQLQLNAYLMDVSWYCADPAALEEIIAAGAQPLHEAPIPRLTGFAVSACAAFHALEARNAPAFLALLARDASQAAEMTQKYFEKSQNETAAAHAIADMLTNNADLSGLGCLHALEQAWGLKWSMQSLSFRATVLERHLRMNAGDAKAWDARIVNYLMGAPVDPADPAHGGLPPQTFGIRFDAFKNLPYDATKRLLVTALNTHCWPVIERLKEPLIWLQRNGQMPWPAAAKPSGQSMTSTSSTTTGFPSCSALSAMVSPIAGQPPTNFDDFDALFKCIKDWGLLDIDLSPRCEERPIPAMHQVALGGGPEKHAMLRHLMGLGLDPHAKNNEAKSALDQLEPQEKEQWEAIVRSFQARQAAQETLSQLTAAPAP